jgi:hypothetical protein
MNLGHFIVPESKKVDKTVKIHQNQYKKATIQKGECLK